MTIDNSCDKLMYCACRIGIVTVYHYIDVSVDVSKYLSYNGSLTLPSDVDYLGTCRKSKLFAVIG